MILCTALGFGARQVLHWEPGVGVGLLAGLLIANLVPARAASCRVAPPDRAKSPPVE